MKYILGLAFEYNYYKNPLKIRLYADSTLIDELVVDKSIGRKKGKWKEENLLKRNRKFARWLYCCKDFSLCEKIFLYEIDDDFLKKKISIEVINDNNNYNNGFMTKFSWIQFDMIFLMPKKYFEDIRLVQLEQRWVLGDKHGLSSPYDRDQMHHWHWPGLQGQFYDPEIDDYDFDTDLNNFANGGVRMGQSFSYDFDIGQWQGMSVLKPKNVSDKFLDELYCYMQPTFLTYYMDGNLINRINEN